MQSKLQTLESIYPAPAGRTKIENNRERDLKDYAFLESLGWRVIVVWECELKKALFDATIASVRKQLEANRDSWLADIADRRQRRKEWQAEIKRRKERAASRVLDLSR